MAKYYSPSGQELWTGDVTHYSCGEVLRVTAGGWRNGGLEEFVPTSWACPVHGELSGREELQMFTAEKRWYPYFEPATPVKREG